MSNSVNELINRLKSHITCLSVALIEMKKIMTTQNKEGELNEIIEKIEAYQKEFRMIKTKTEKASNEEEVEQIREELTKLVENIKKDPKTKEIKRKKAEYFKYKWEITIDIMMIIGKYFFLKTTILML